MTQANSNGGARENETPAVTVGALHAIQTSSGATIDPYVVHAETEIAAGQAKYSLRAVSRFKWTFLVIFLVIGVTGTAAAWSLIKPKYEATAQLDAEPRRILYRDDDNRRGAYGRHLKTLVGLIKSNAVLKQVVTRPDVLETAWYQERPRVFFGNPPTHEERLHDVIEVKIAHDSFLIEIRATTSNAQDAAILANAVQDVFVNYVKDVASEDSEYVMEKLEPWQKRLNSTIRDDMRDSFEDMKKLEAVSPEDMIASRMPPIRELRTRIAELDNQIDYIDAQIGSNADQSRGMPEAADADPGKRYLYESDPTWAGLNGKLDAALMQLGDKSGHAGAAHPTVRLLTEKIATLENKRRDREAELDEWLARGVIAPPRTNRPGNSTLLDTRILTADLDGLNQRKKLFEEMLKKTEQRFDDDFVKVMKLHEQLDKLRKDRETKSKIDKRLDFLETEGLGLVIRKAAEASAPSYHSNWKRPFLFTGMSLFAGMFVGFMSVNWRARRTPDARDFSRFSKAPVLGLLPPVRSNGSEPGQGLQSESIRVIRTAVLHRLHTERGAVIMFTSSGAGTGKTTTAVNFAISLARAGKSVLLVDADFRRPHVAETLGIESEIGFAEVLSAETTDAEAIVLADTPGLSVLPGTRDRVEDNVELLANGKFTACLARWRQNYDFIVLDCCPVQPMADAQMLFPHVDGVIVVVREGRCRQRDLDSALACIDSGGGRLLGTVFVVPRRSYNSQYYQYEYAKS